VRVIYAAGETADRKIDINAAGEAAEWIFE